MNAPADLLAVWAGVNWREQGRGWHESMMDPSALFRMPFIRWCGLYLPPQSAKETVWKLGANGTSWKDVRAAILARKKAKAEAAHNGGP